MTNKTSPHIPYDMYESPQELVIIMPLGGIKKETIELNIKDYRLIISGERPKPTLKDDFMLVKEDCYRGPINQILDLPPQVYFDKIHSKISADNVLHIIIPKAIVPEKIDLEIEND